MLPWPCSSNKEIIKIMSRQHEHTSQCDGPALLTCERGIVLALDGFLSLRTQPRKDECVNTADYFSGHKKVPAINVQAADSQ
jgi:hypothetical protein